MKTHLGILLAAFCLVAPGIATPALSGQARPAAMRPDLDFEPYPEPQLPPPPPGSPDAPPEQDGITIRGHERLAWDQVASSPDELATFGYIAYVDDVPTDAQEVRCASTDGPDGFECTSRLPDMTPGTHTIEVSAFTTEGDRVEGPRSAPIVVRLANSSSGTFASAPGARSFETTDALSLAATVVATGLDDPTAVAALPDGRILVAERSGRIRVVHGGVLMSAPAVTLTDLTTGDGRGLLALVADRAFAETNAVYVLYTTDDGLRLARFTLSGDTLIARAILVDGLPISSTEPHAALAAGPDGRLYLALDNAGDAVRTGDLGSFSGKILRLNVDGTTPDDQAGVSPVYAIGVDRPTGMAWSRDNARMWVAGMDAKGAPQVQAIASSDPPRRGTTVARFALPSGMDGSAVALYQNAAVDGFGGNLLVTSEQAQAILRIRFEPSGDVAAAEWLLREQVGPISAIDVAMDGAIYIATATELVRIGVAGQQ